MSELDVLKDISIKLKKAGIPFMLSGSLAMSYYAMPRMTRDIDIVIELNAQSIHALSTLFGDEYYLSEESIADAVKNESMFNLIHNRAIIKVDFIVRKNSEYRIIEFNRRRKIKLQDFFTYIFYIYCCS